MLQQSKIYCQCCNSVSASCLCPLSKQWPWSMDIVHTSGCAGADCGRPAMWTIRASGLELRFINVILSLSGLWCSPSLAAVSKGGVLTVFGLSIWEDRLGPCASLGSPLTFCIFRSCLPLPQAMPSADGSNGLFLSKSTPWWMRGHCKFPSMGNPPNVQMQT